MNFGCELKDDFEDGFINFENGRLIKLTRDEFIEFTKFIRDKKNEGYAKAVNMEVLTNE